MRYASFDKTFFVSNEGKTGKVQELARPGWFRLNYLVVIWFQDPKNWGIPLFTNHVGVIVWVKGIDFSQCRFSICSDLAKYKGIVNISFIVIIIKFDSLLTFLALTCVVWRLIVILTNGKWGKCMFSTKLRFFHSMIQSSVRKSILSTLRKIYSHPFWNIGNLLWTFLSNSLWFMDICLKQIFGLI